MRPAVVAGLSATLLVGGCFGGSTPDDTKTVTQTVVRTVTPAPSPTTDASGGGDDGPSGSSSGGERTFVMPDVVGRVLQDAQDDLQKLGSYLMDQQDAAGSGRIQVNDSNWKVCSQKPAPGERVPLQTLVVLASVKLSEDCPGAT